jgi:hypothetical protein
MLYLDKKKYNQSETKIICDLPIKRDRLHFRMSHRNPYKFNKQCYSLLLHTGH